jgi:hypothetical protein
VEELPNEDATPFSAPFAVKPSGFCLIVAANDIVCV